METDTENVSEAALKNRARRAAERVGLRAEKSRWRLHSVDNRGGFQLIDPYRKAIVAGQRFDMTAQEVIDFCKEV